MSAGFAEIWLLPYFLSVRSSGKAAEEHHKVLQGSPVRLAPLVQVFNLRANLHSQGRGEKGKDIEQRIPITIKEKIHLHYGNLPSTSEVRRVTLAAFLRPAGSARPILSSLSRRLRPPSLDFALKGRVGIFIRGCWKRWRALNAPPTSKAIKRVPFARQKAFRSVVEGHLSLRQPFPPSLPPFLPA